jgi:hypothetical protein
LDRKVYLRKSNRLIKGKIIPSLDIASIEVWIPQKGTGTSIINKLHELNPFGVTFIENVINEHLEKWINRNDWTYYPLYSLDHCYYKLK